MQWLIWTQSPILTFEFNQFQTTVKLGYVARSYVIIKCVVCLWVQPRRQIIDMTELSWYHWIQINLKRLNDLFGSIKIIVIKTLLNQEKQPTCFIHFGWVGYLDRALALLSIGVSPKRGKKNNNSDEIKHSCTMPRPHNKQF